MVSEQQLGLFDKPRSNRGGKRRGAGRKPAQLRPGKAHTKRPELKWYYPVHVVLRVASSVGNMRRRETYLAVRKATQTIAGRDGFRIVQLSLQRNHIHLIIEASNERVLSSGMQVFQISAARHINAALIDKNGNRRRGTVFPDRYFASIITSPKQARHTISYVLGNWRKHQEDRAQATRGWKIDWFSSAPSFPGWAEGSMLSHEYKDYQPLIVGKPETWLLRVGLQQAGSISCYETPASAARRPARQLAASRDS